MIPKLYDRNNNFIGDLTECSRGIVIEERNGMFELEIDYQMYAPNWDKLSRGNIIVAHANDKLLNQMFRIYKVTKDIRGHFTVYAQHISYDLCRDFIDAFRIEKESCEYCLNKIFLNSQFSQKFKGYSDIFNARNYNVNKPKNVFSAIIGSSGSIIDTFGNGAELLRDNYNISVLAKRGSDNGVVIEYSKNLTGLDYEEDSSNLITRIRAFAKYQGVPEDDKPPVEDDTEEAPNKEAFNNGYKEGYIEGYRQGYLDGEINNYNRSYGDPDWIEYNTNGGYNSGYTMGNNYGYDKGFTDGRFKYSYDDKGYLDYINSNTKSFRSVSDDTENAETVEMEVYTYVDSPNIGKYETPFISEIDFSDKFQEGTIPTKNALNALAISYFKNNKCDEVDYNYKVSFIPLSKCAGYENIEDNISLCDTVTIKDKRYDLDLKSKIIKVEYDFLSEKYESMELGKPKFSIVDIFGNDKEDVNNSPNGGSSGGGTVTPTMTEIEVVIPSNGYEFNLISDSRQIVGDGSIDWGDGTSGSLEDYYHTYMRKGTYKIKGNFTFGFEQPTQDVKDYMSKVISMYSEPTNLSSAFYECKNLTSIDLSKVDTSSVTTMADMFYDCSRLTNIDLSMINTRSVKDMSRMFSSCSNLQEVNISNFNTSLLTSIQSMFYSCGNLTTLKMNNWNKMPTSDYMFTNCYSLENIYFKNNAKDDLTHLINLLPNRSGKVEGNLYVTNYTYDDEASANIINWNLIKENS